MEYNMARTTPVPPSQQLQQHYGPMNTDFDGLQQYVAAQNPAVVSSLQEYLTAASPQGAGAGAGAAVEFADLLAEFTLPDSSMMSPETLGKSPGPSTSNSLALGGDFGTGNSNAFMKQQQSNNTAGYGRQREKSVQETLLEQLGFPLAQHGSASNAPSPNSPAHSASPVAGPIVANSSAPSSSSKDHVTHAIASMDSNTRSQLLNALLTLKQQQQQQNGTSPAQSQASPRNVVNSPRSSLHHNSPRVYDQSQQQTHLHHQQQQHSTHPSPLATVHSQHNSPHSLSSYNSPAPQYQHQAQQQLAAQLSGSLPPSLVSSPAASPYLHATQPNQFTPTPGPVSTPQSLPSYVGIMGQTTQPDAFAQQQFKQHLMAQQQPVPPQSQQQAPPPPQQQQQQQQQQQRLRLQHQQYHDVQMQLAMDMLARANGQQPAPVGGDMNLRGAATGESYASSTARREDWSGDNDFMFSPLMSPAMTPQSVFTAASSLPASTYMASGSLVSPADFFSPLGSPAMMPQFHDEASAAAYHQQQLQNRASLQGLVDQTRALGFDASGLTTLGYGSPVIAPQTGVSPRLGPTTSGADAGQGTATGSGRRGAGSSKKTRPSPLLKPTPDGQLRRKKATGNDRRSSSISSATGNRSNTNSPFLGPTQASNGRSLVATSTSVNGNGSSAKTSASDSQKTSSPDEQMAINGAINTPSPVDLAMHDASTTSQQQHQLHTTALTNTYQHELMGPPPLPSTSASASRRQSLNGNVGSEQMNPVTPASFMNLPADFDMTTLSSLQPVLPALQSALGKTKGQDLSTVVASASTSEQESTSGPSKKASALVPIAPAPPAASAESKPKVPKLLPRTASNSSSNADASTSGSATPTAPVISSGTSATITSTAKGKARAVHASTAAAEKKATGKTKKSPKVVGTTKIKSLLPGGVAPDDVSRLSSKSNYQNIVEGKGDLIGLNASAVAAMSTGGADVRRTSHKAAEQKRRDSLKARFEDLRVLLPPIAMSADERRPGEGNVGGQRNGTLDPNNPNKGVSKVALLRRSNEYIGMLLERVERRDLAIKHMREKVRKMRSELGLPDEESEEEVPGLDLDNIDRDEREAGTMAFYENLSDDEEDEEKPKVARRASTARRRSSVTAADAEPKNRPAVPARRSTRRSTGAAGAQLPALTAVDDDDMADGSVHGDDCAMVEE